MQTVKTTPEIDAILSELTELCCNALTASDELDHARVDELVESLSTNGWERHRGDAAPLSSILKDRIKGACSDPALHRGAALDGLVSSVQQAYRNVG